MKPSRVNVVQDGDCTILKHPLTQEGFITQLVPDCFTIFDHFLKTVRYIPDRPYLGTRGGSGEYVWKSYKQIHDDSFHLASALVDMKLVPTLTIDKYTIRVLGLYAKNREEMAVCQLAAIRQDISTVALYETLGEVAMIDIINEVKMTVMCCASTSFGKIMALKPSCPTLENIILFEEPSEEQIAEAKKASVNLFQYRELLSRNLEVNDSPPTPDSILLFCYTSGTTGVPKGVIITHRQMLAQLAGVSATSAAGSPKSVHLSYLPYAHIYEIICLHAITLDGGRIGFYSGDITKILDDVQTLKPNGFAAVPRILNRIFDTIEKEISKQNIFVRALFRLAVNSKLRNLKKHGLLTGRWDFMFKKVRAILGGNVKGMGCGSAPAKFEVMNFTMIAFCCPVMEGYGQTESTALISSIGQHIGACKGTVGYPLPHLEVKLKPVEDMDGKEITYRGPVAMPGYLLKDKENQETIDKDGFVASGDIAVLVEDNALKIIDRAKNIIKFSQGEFIAPEKLENVYLLAPSVAQIFVTGKSTENYCVAIVVPDFENLKNYFNINNSEMVNSEEVKEFVWKDMMKQAHEQCLNRLEQPLQIFLVEEEFSIQNDMLTPTLKLKRPVAKRIFQDHIERLYTLPVLR